MVKALHGALDIDLARGHIEEISAQPVAVVAAVGDRMRGTPGIAATVFGALGSDGINVMAISQGSSERNISLVVAESDAATAVRCPAPRVPPRPRGGRCAMKCRIQNAEFRTQAEPGTILHSAFCILNYRTRYSCPSGTY